MISWSKLKSSHRRLKSTWKWTQYCFKTCKASLPPAVCHVNLQMRSLHPYPSSFSLLIRGCFFFFHFFFVVLSDCKLMTCTASHWVMMEWILIAFWQEPVPFVPLCTAVDHLARPSERSAKGYYDRPSFSMISPSHFLILACIFSIEVQRTFFLCSH